MNWRPYSRVYPILPHLHYADATSRKQVCEKIKTKRLTDTLRIPYSHKPTKWQNTGPTSLCSQCTLGTCWVPGASGTDQPTRATVAPLSFLQLQAPRHPHPRVLSSRVFSPLYPTRTPPWICLLSQNYSFLSLTYTCSKLVYPNLQLLFFKWSLILKPKSIYVHLPPNPPF